MYALAAVKSNARVTATCPKEDAVRIEFTSGRGRGRMDYFALLVSRRVASEIHVVLGDALTQALRKKTSAK